MLGKLLSIVREEKQISKTELANLTGINVGHLTHIEKGERNPSHKALKTICSALQIPYQPLLYTYDKETTEQQEEFHLFNNIPYNKIPLISNVESLIECPYTIPNAALAFKMPDDTMKSSIPKDTVCYLEMNTIPLHKEFGLFQYNNQILVRRLMYKKSKIVLKSDALLSKDISISDSDSFYIIGKVYVEK